MILANELLYLSSVMLRINQIASVSLFHNFYLFFKITEVGSCLVCRFELRSSLLTLGRVETSFTLLSLMRSLEVLQITIPVGGCATSVNQEIGTADETSSGGHQELCQIAHFVRCSGTAGGHALNHLQVTILAWAMQFIVGQWRDDDTW